MRLKARRCTDPKLGANFSFTGVLERLLNKHFPCSSEAPAKADGDNNITGLGGRSGAARAGHSWRHRGKKRLQHSRNAAEPATTAGSAEPQEEQHRDQQHQPLSRAQLSGRHVVENFGRHMCGSFFWMQEMARWRHSPAHDTGNPFDDIVDLVRACASAHTPTQRHSVHSCTSSAAWAHRRGRTLSTHQKAALAVGGRATRPPAGISILLRCLTGHCRVGNQRSSSKGGQLGGPSRSGQRCAEPGRLLWPVLPSPLIRLTLVA